MSTALTISEGRSLAVPSDASLVWLANVVDQPLEWLWPGRIPLGALTLIIGEPGMGKGFLSVDLASRVSRGMGWPDAPDQAALPGSVLLLSAEDNLAGTILARLKAAGGDLNKIATLQAGFADERSRIRRPVSLQQDLASLEAALAELPDCRLVVIDPITAYLGKSDGNRNGEIRSLLQPLNDLAAAYRVAIVAVSHLNKSGIGRAINRTMGALAFVAASRTVWGVVADPEQPESRLFLPVKSNLAHTEQGLRFCVPTPGAPGVPRVMWDAEPVSTSIDEALYHSRRFNLAEQNYRDAENFADVMLREHLSGGPREREWIGLSIMGFSDSQLHRASVRVGVVKMKRGCGGWMWMLPEHVDEWLRSEAEKKREEKEAEERRAAKRAEKKQQQEQQQQQQKSA
jgi:putative DNA primase/helicase